MRLHIKRNKRVITALFLLTSISAMAQGEIDPVLLRIGGKPVTRAECEYSYNKNNSITAQEKLTAKEYVDLFVNYKLKVRAALDARLDTLSSFKEEFAMYRDQQILPTFLTDADVEQEAQKLYEETRHSVDSMGGMVKPAVILLAVKQADNNQIFNSKKIKADSLYSVLKANAFDEKLFEELSRKYSDDKALANEGGIMPWITKGQTLPEFENVVFSLQKGQTSEPIKTTVGYMIIQLREKRNYFSYDEVRPQILAYLDQQHVKEQMQNQKIESIVRAEGDGATKSAILARREKELTAADSDLKYLIQEYHDGLLLYEISNMNVWARASNDEQALAKYYKKNKKKYSWTAPRFKGIAYRCKEAADVSKVKAVLKKVDYKQWNELLAAEFNKDGVLRIKAEKGIFKQGDNPIVDKYSFNASADVPEVADYKYEATYGKMLKKPENYEDVKSLVVADYQEELDKYWLADLRKKYPVEIDSQVLSTVNKH